MKLFDSGRTEFFVSYTLYKDSRTERERDNKIIVFCVSSILDWFFFNTFFLSRLVGECKSAVKKGTAFPSKTHK